MTIEEALRWAIRDELPKRREDSPIRGPQCASDPVWRMVAMGGPVDNWSREPGMPPAMGDPHPDAILIEAHLQVLCETLKRAAVGSAVCPLDLSPYPIQVTAIAALYDASALTARLTIDEAALAAEQSARVSAVAAEASARAAADTSATGRLAALEVKPEEVAHFTATAAVPALSVLVGGSVTLTNLTPACVGDVVKAGEAVRVAAPGGLPAGAGIANVRVPADGTVIVQLVTSVAISAGQPIAWAIEALR